ncbi:hypothetical protein ACVWYF_003878 [Hymenobacter sp. UYAg731]
MRIEAMERQLDNMFQLAASMPPDEPQARLAEYLCIRTSGLMEQVVKHLLKEYAKSTSATEVAKYVEGKTERIANLPNDKLVELLLSFSDIWRDEYVTNVTEEAAGALSSIVGLRNKLAHGIDPGGISYGRIQGYYTNVRTIFPLLKRIISKDRPRLRRTR